MGNQIDSAKYVAGMLVRSSLQTKTAQAEKDKKKPNKFKEILKSVLPQIEQKNEEDIIDQISRLSQEEAIALLQDHVRSAGDTLKSRQNPETILRYKQAVKNFVAYVTREAYDVKTRTHVYRDKTNHLRPHPFTQIVVINEKLDQFADELLRDQKSQLFILERLEELYGLLIDLIT